MSEEPVMVSDFDLLMFFAAVLSLPVTGLIIIGIILLVQRIRSRK